MRALISTRHLLRALRAAPAGEPVWFQCVAGEPGISVGGTPCGGQAEPFADLSIMQDKADRLIRILQHVSDQPITLIADSMGERISIHQIDI